MMTPCGNGPPSGVRVNLPQGITHSSGEEGDNSPPTRDERDETRDPGTAGNNPLGTGDGGKVIDSGGDQPLRVDDIADRFRKATINRFSPGSNTAENYLWLFGRFARHADLEALTKRQLHGKGRVLILSFMATIPLRSKRKTLGALEAVWTEGIVLPWPINQRRDFGKTLPPTGRRESPKDSDVKPWLHAVENEADFYTKLFVLLELNYGWRPNNQTAHARWRWVQTDEQGRPSAFVTKDGAEEGFKSHSRIVAYIPPMVADTMEAFKRVSPRTDPDAHIFPRRYVRESCGHTKHRPEDCKQKDHPKGYDATKPIDQEGIRRLWGWFESKWNLKPMPPAYFRHWVKTACRPLSDPSISALQGHRPPQDRGMRNVYDTPAIEAILDEQRTAFPHGALGTLKPPTVTVVDGLEPYLGPLREWLDGRIGLMDLMGSLEAVQRRMATTKMLKP